MAETPVQKPVVTPTVQQRPPVPPVIQNPPIPPGTAAAPLMTLTPVTLDTWSTVKDHIEQIKMLLLDKENSEELANLLLHLGNAERQVDVVKEAEAIAAAVAQVEEDEV